MPLFNINYDLIKWKLLSNVSFCFLTVRTSWCCCCRRLHHKIWSIDDPLNSFLFGLMQSFARQTDIQRFTLLYRWKRRVHEQAGLMKKKTKWKAGCSCRISLVHYLNEKKNLKRFLLMICIIQCEISNLLTVGLNFDCLISIFVWLEIQHATEARVMLRSLRSSNTHRAHSNSAHVSSINSNYRSTLFALHIGKQHGKNLLSVLNYTLNRAQWSVITECRSMNK